MAIKDCIAEIQKLAGEDLTKDDIEAIASEVERRAASKKRTDKLLSDQEALDVAAKEIAADMLTGAQVEARNQVINMLTRQRVKEFVQQAVGAGLRPDEAIQALNVGINKKVPGARLSVEARQRALEAEFLGGLVKDLESAGLLEYMTRRLGLFGRDGGVVDRDIARALWSIGEDGKAKADVPPEMARIAEIIHTHQEAMRLRANRAGAYIRKAPGYIARQSHDQAAIRKAGMEAWIATVRPMLDAERTFGAKDPAAFLKATYLALSSGEHIKTDRAASDTGFYGPGNRAKSMSQERVLHFKDADSWVAYNDKFGTRNVTEAVIMGFQRGAQDIGLMEAWGTNPRAMFDSVLDDLRKSNREAPDLVDKLKGANLQNQFGEVDGSSRVVMDLGLAEKASAVRALQSMAKLGASTISSITDIATSASELRYQGENLGAAYTGVLSEMMTGRSGAEQRALAAEIGVGLDGVLGDVASRFNGQDTLPGTASKLMRLYFKMNGLSWWTDSVKTSAGRMMAWRAAQQTKLGWNKVDAKFKEAIAGYGIGADEWDVIRQAKVRQADAKEYLTAAGVRDLPDSAFAKLGGDSPAKAQRLRDELSTKLQAFYSDRVDFAVVTPGARERAILAQGTQRGTWMGESLRFVMQFKAFPVSFATKVWGRDMNGYGLTEALLQGKGDLLGLAHTVAATTVLGMIALQTKEILKGRSPRDPFGEKWAPAWAAAFTQGGGLGIYGDFLFGEANRFGGGLLETLAGPTLGSISDAKDIWDRIRKGDDPSAQAIRFATGNTPFVNLPYTKIVLDYLVLYELQEMASPGYLKRMEDRLRKENDQTMIFPPSESVAQ